MKTKMILYFSLIGLLLLAVKVPIAGAYDQYTSTGSNYCASCHGDFRSTSSSLAAAKSANPAWTDSLHNIHRYDMLNGNCDACHSSGSRTPVYLNHSNGSSPFNLSCSGCHDGPGLRKHHATAGITTCAGCHPNDPTPDPENVLRPVYTAAFGVNSGTTQVNDACDPAAEGFEGRLADVVTIGLDNDGNGLYDQNDPACVQTGNVSTKIGIFRNASWFLDTNGNNAWDVGTDSLTRFGNSGDIPVTGDWDGTGVTRIGVFRDGLWYLDMDGNGTWDAGVDSVTRFGKSGDIPVTGAWDGTGVTRIGVFRDGLWYLDMDGNGTWDTGVDSVTRFGKSGDIPVTGDWDGTGVTRVGVFRDGQWYLDINGNGVWDTGVDAIAGFGKSGDIPVTGTWDGTGVTRVGVFRDGLWYLDMDGDNIWDAGVDTLARFGTQGDIPVTGKW